MTTFLLSIWLITAIALAVTYFLKQRSNAETAQWKKQAEAALQAKEEESARAGAAAQACVARAEKALEQRLVELDAESSRIAEHYEKEALKVYEEATQQLQDALDELAPLRGYASLQDAESEVRRTLAEALAEAAALRQEAQSLVEQTRVATLEERRALHQRATDTRDQAESLLNRATRDAGRIREAAELRAEQVAGDAYVALRDKGVLEQALGALWDEINGYGDRYVIPTRSLLDELAADFSHTKAGEELKAAREQSRRLVELGLAATCNYEEEDRRNRANRFIIDAFNGRVDAILSRTKNDNYGTLERELRNAFALVNSNGLVFRDARILPAYLDSRLAELKWAVVVQELKHREREEQREIQAQIREEEKARRDYERAMQEAAREEAAIKQAMERARAEVEHVSAEEKARLEAELSELNQRLAEAEAKGQRALSMAQQTRAGNVYIISNIGSFGDDVLKIGMTRRLVPEDRIRELGDASVPFAFDVHAMIRSDDAPALERMIHQAFEDARINKVNFRKEFFRVPLERVRALAVEKGLEITFTIAAAAREFRESLALAKMTLEDREKYHLRETAEEELLAEDQAASGEQ